MTPEEAEKYAGFDAFSARFREIHCIYNRRCVVETTDVIWFPVWVLAALAARFDTVVL